MKLHFKLAALCIVAATLFITSCSREQIEQQLITPKNTIAKQYGHGIGNAEDTILEGTGYQVRILSTVNSFTVNEYYNTTGFTLSWQRVRTGVWKATIGDNRYAEISEIDIKAAPAAKSHADDTGWDYQFNGDNDDGIYIEAYHNSKPDDKADIWVHLDIYTIDHPDPITD